MSCFLMQQNDNNVQVEEDEKSNRDDTNKTAERDAKLASASTLSAIDCCSHHVTLAAHLTKVGLQKGGKQT